jgi:hypothetical protein
MKPANSEASRNSRPAIQPRNWKDADQFQIEAEEALHLHGGGCQATGSGDRGEIASE